MRQNLQHVMRVAQVRDAMEDARFPREQSRGEDRERGIFRAADLDRAGKRIAAVNEDLIHTWQTGIVSLLHNRFLTRCRGNFSPPEARKKRLALADPDLEREQATGSQMFLCLLNQASNKLIAVVASEKGDFWIV